MKEFFKLQWVSIGALVFVGSSFGQETEPLSSDAGVSSEPHLEEILVTALRRQESSQDLGLTLVVLNEKELERRLTHSLPDIAYLLNNVEMFEDFGGQGQPVWVIRGVGLQDFNANNTPTAAAYIDEVYQSSSAQGGSALFDTQQVEVLKGPQGGLYGRNTSGGVVRQVTNRASTHGPESEISLGFASWRETRLSSTFNIPVTDHSAIRIAGQLIESKDAWQTSIPSSDHHGEKDLWDLRAWWLTQLTDTSKIEVKVYGGENNSELPLARSVGLYNADGSFCDAVLQGRRDDSNCVNYAGIVDPLNQLSPVSAQSQNGSRSLSDPINQLDNDYLGASVYYTSELRLGMLGPTEMQLIANRESFNYGMVFDYDGSPGEFGHQQTASDIDTQSLELRLLSKSDGRLNWQMGALLANESFTEDRQFYLADNTLVGLVLGQLDYTQVTHSRAVYAQGAYQLDTDWEVTGSVRYSTEQKKYRDGSVLAPAFPSPYDVIAGDLNGDYSLGARWSGSVGLNWQVADNTLLYSSVSKGFKAGGFFGGFVFDPLEFVSYVEETVYAYEVGTKTLLADERLQLNAALFWYDYRDVQGFKNVSVTPGNGAGTLVLEQLGSIGDAEHSGVDIDMAWLVGGGWSVAAGLSYLDARVVKGDEVSVNLLGNEESTRGERPYAPHWSSFASVTYEAEINSSLALDGAVTWHYRDDFSGHLSSNVDKAISSLPGYALVDAYLALGSVANDWKVSLWAKNLTDKDYSPRRVYDSLGSYVDIMGQARSYGMQLQYRW